MKKILMNAANLTLGEGSYESPEVKVTEIHSEGVLCTSGQFEEWDTATLDW